MTTLAEAEARIDDADVQIRKRLRRGLTIPARWHEVYNEAWIELLAVYEQDHPVETRRYRRALGEADAPLVQAGLGITTGRWRG